MTEIETSVVWVNVYRTDDGRLKTEGVHPSRSKAEASRDTSRHSVGLNRIALRAEYDKESIPQEPGVLVWKKVKLKSGKVAQVVFDRRTVGSVHTWPLVVVLLDDTYVTSVLLSDIQEVLED